MIFQLPYLLIEPLEGLDFVLKIGKIYELKVNVKIVQYLRMKRTLYSKMAVELQQRQYNILKNTTKKYIAGVEGQQKA